MILRRGLVVRLRWEAGVRRQAGRVIRDSSASTEVARLVLRRSQGDIRRWWAFSAHMESVDIEEAGVRRQAEMGLVGLETTWKIGS